MTEPQIPRMCDLMTPAIDALIAPLEGQARVARAHHANHGVYGNILRGWRAQGELVRARFSRENIATRLIDVNGGQPLRDLAASEYFAQLASEPQYAIGEVFLERQKTSSSSSATGTFLAGVIPTGTSFYRPQTDGDVPLSDVQFKSLADVVCSADDTVAPHDNGDGTWLHRQTVSVPIQAAQPGEDSNTQLDAVYASPPQKLFDSAQPVAERFTTTTIYSAGGSVSVSDAQLIDFARSMGAGYNGANNAAALAGCRSDPRVRRVAAALDYSTAILWLYIADQSWATSLRYRETIKQKLFDNKWIGFGARVAIGRIYNVPITVRATVYLRNKTVEAERSAVQAAIQQKLAAYFDNRADFYTWRLSAIGGVIAAADARVQTAANPAVMSAGVVLSEPATTITGGAASIPHYYLLGVDLTFTSLGS